MKQRILRYLKSRLNESSTWRNLIITATAFGITIEPNQQEAIVAAGLMLAGLIGVILPDNL